jgi:hypothetical protein
VHESRGAAAADGLEQDERAAHVGIDSGSRGQNAAIDVRFGGEMHDRIGSRLERLVHGVRITDVGTYERVSGIVFDRSQILEIAGIGQFVDIHDADVGVRGQRPANESGPNESGSARHYQLHSGQTIP